MQTISIIASWNDGSESGGCVLQFTTERTDLSSEDVILSEIRGALRDYLQTEEGQAANEAACNNFNWGDALDSVPDEVYLAIGLTPIPMPIANIVIAVDHDEPLMAD